MRRKDIKRIDSLEAAIEALEKCSLIFDLYEQHQNSKKVANEAKKKNIETLREAVDDLHKFGKFILGKNKSKSKSNNNNEGSEDEIKGEYSEDKYDARHFHEALSKVKNIIFLNIVNNDNYNSVLFKTNKVIIDFIFQIASNPKYINKHFKDENIKKGFNHEIYRYAMMIFFHHAKAFEYSTSTLRILNVSSKNPAWIDEALPICLLGEPSQSNIEYLMSNYISNSDVFNGRYFIEFHRLGTSLKHDKEYHILSETIKTSEVVEAYLPWEIMGKCVDILSALEHADIYDTNKDMEKNPHEKVAFFKNIVLLGLELEASHLKNASNPYLKKSVTGVYGKINTVALALRFIPVSQLPLIGSLVEMAGESYGETDLSKKARNLVSIDDSDKSANESFHESLAAALSFKLSFLISKTNTVGLMLFCNDVTEAANNIIKNISNLDKLGESERKNVINDMADNIIFSKELNKHIGRPVKAILSKENDNKIHLLSNEVPGFNFRVGKINANQLNNVFFEIEKSLYKIHVLVERKDTLIKEKKLLLNSLIPRKEGKEQIKPAKIDPKIEIKQKIASHNDDIQRLQERIRESACPILLYISDTKSNNQEASPIFAIIYTDAIKYQLSMQLIFNEKGEEENIRSLLMIIQQAEKKKNAPLNPINTFKNIFWDTSCLIINSRDINTKGAKIIFEMSKEKIYTHTDEFILCENNNNTKSKFKYELSYEEDDKEYLSELTDISSKKSKKTTSLNSRYNMFSNNNDNDNNNKSKQESDEFDRNFKRDNI